MLGAYPRSYTFVNKKEVLAMHSSKEINIGGHKIVAKVFNEDKTGIPVVFIHGITATIDFWEPVQTPIIKNNFRWYSLSLPGHFPAKLPSVFNKESITPDMISLVLTDAIKKIVDDQPVILAGHSTGGFAALCIAANNPEIAAGVISISGFAHGRWTGALGIFQMLARFGLIGRILFKINFNILASNRWIYRFGVGLYANDRKALYSNSVFKTGVDIAYQATKTLDINSLLPFFNRLPDIDISEQLSNITSPTLALAGDSDPIVPPEQSRIIAERVSKGEKVFLEGAGHLPMFERQNEYNQAITSWIEKLS
jgi:pimeloyl-ACP methyl ester carboxylesterase